MTITSLSDDWPRFDNYRPLNSIGRRQIRLLKFKHDGSGKPSNLNLRRPLLSLEIVALNEDPVPQYYALSYNWGSDSRMTTIVIDGKPVSVRQTLANFLHFFCLQFASLVAKPGDTFMQRLISGYEVRFWLDALCINQKDEKEKSEQVKMMSDIYKSAHRVVAWIGDKTLKSAALFQLIQQGGPDSGYKWPSWWNLPAHEQRIVREGLEDILSRPYWSRLWILQEIAHAKRAFVMCGSSLCYWGSLGDPINYLRVGNGLEGPGVDTWIMMKESNIIWEELQTPRGWKPGMSPLATVVSKFYQARCSDPRDKLYGLLSMASDPDRSSIPVDYSHDKTAWDVLLDFWKHYTKRHPGTQEVRERRVIGLVWLLWSQMEIGGLPFSERFQVCARNARKMKSILGYEGFRIRAKPLVRYGDSKLTVTDHGEWAEEDYYRKSFFDFTPPDDAYDDYSKTRVSRRWLVVASKLQPGDICFVAENQPSSIQWQGDLETIPNQSLIILRFYGSSCTCVGRGKELMTHCTVGEGAVEVSFNPSA